MKQILLFVLVLTFVNAIFGLSSSSSTSFSSSISMSLSNSVSPSFSSSVSISQSWSTSLSNSVSISQSWTQTITQTISQTQSWTSSVSTTQSWTQTNTQSFTGSVSRSFSGTSNCGNGVINSNEQCDNGANSGSISSCCTPQCTFKPANVGCGVRKGDCYKKPVCNEKGVCVNSALKTSGVPCKNQKKLEKSVFAKEIHVFNLPRLQKQRHPRVKQQKR